MNTTPLPVNGVDLSHHQDGKLDFVKAKQAGVEFVYHKCTEGATWVDENYNRRRSEVEAAGLVFGAYHFARPAIRDAKIEARHFVEHAQPKRGDLRPALDLETTDGLSLSILDVWARLFCDEVKLLTGFDCVIYTPYNLPSVARLPLWVARYSNSNADPIIPKAWEKATIRQFSNGVYGVPSSVPGIGHCDLNTWGPGASLKDIQIPITRGQDVDIAIEDVRQAGRRPGTKRASLLKSALETLKKIKPLR